MPMTRIMTIANPQGGSGKTTTALHLAYGFAESGLRVLAIDLDPCASLTNALGCAPAPAAASMITLSQRLAAGEVDAAAWLCKTAHPAITLLPADYALIGAEAWLYRRDLRSLERAIKNTIKHVDLSFDLVILDTPPSLRPLLLPAIFAADFLLIPAGCDYAGWQGFNHLYQVLPNLKQSGWKGSLLGVLPIGCTASTESARKALDSFRQLFKDIPRAVLPPIRRAAIFEKCPETRQSVFQLSPRSRAAQDYRRAIRIILQLIRI